MRADKVESNRAYLKKHIKCPLFRQNKTYFLFSLLFLLDYIYQV